jgi:hypothetical protein
METLRQILIGVGSIILEPFKGDPIASVTITVPSENAIAEDFSRVTADFSRAVEKVKNENQLELFT